mmetsp:Transcript_39673/g.86605  ORF Transcript_39673/g.86605 Transcript_39673/m.86605 type:complete len:272 (-) Transcript_39673:1080-1895(-)
MATNAQFDADRVTNPLATAPCCAPWGTGTGAPVSCLCPALRGTALRSQRSATRREIYAAAPAPSTGGPVGLSVYQGTSRRTRWLAGWGSSPERSVAQGRVHKILSLLQRSTGICAPSLSIAYPLNLVTPALCIAPTDDSDRSSALAGSSFSVGCLAPQRGGPATTHRSWRMPQMSRTASRHRTGRPAIPSVPRATIWRGTYCVWMGSGSEACARRSRVGLPRWLIPQRLWQFARDCQKGPCARWIAVWAIRPTERSCQHRICTRSSPSLLP